jgi:hypothetical protein
MSAGPVRRSMAGAHLHLEVEGSDAAGNTIRQSVTVRVPLKRA